MTISAAVSGLRLVPIAQIEAKAFIAEHHRHSRPPVGSICQVGVKLDGELVGVAMAGRPVAMMLQDGVTLEIIRTCTNGTPNANSKLYGAMVRAAEGLGYKRLITYTLASEPGSSLKAVGWVPVADVPERKESWARASRKGGFSLSEHQPDLFGLVKMRPTEAKVRWEKAI